AECPVRPIIHESSKVTRVPGAPWRFAIIAAISPPAPAPTTSTSVSIRTPLNFVIRSPGPRPILHRPLHVDDRLRTEDLAAEAGDAMFAELDHRQKLGLNQPGNFLFDRNRLHMDDISRTNRIADAAARAAFDLDFLDHQAWPTTMPMPVIHSGTR